MDWALCRICCTSLEPCSKPVFSSPCSFVELVGSLGAVVPSENFREHRCIRAQDSAKIGSSLFVILFMPRHGSVQKRVEAIGIFIIVSSVSLLLHMCVCVYIYIYATPPD